MSRQAENRVESVSLDYRQRRGDSPDQWDNFATEGLKDHEGKALEVYMSEGVYAWFIKPWLSSKGSAEGAKRIRALVERAVQNRLHGEQGSHMLQYASDFPDSRERNYDLLTDYASSIGEGAILRITFGDEQITEAKKKVATR